MPLVLVIFVAMVFLVTVILAAVGTPWETFLGCAITAAGLPERVNTFSSYINYKYSWHYTYSILGHARP